MCLTNPHLAKCANKIILRNVHILEVWYPPQQLTYLLFVREAIKKNKKKIWNFHNVLIGWGPGWSFSRKKIKELSCFKMIYLL